MASKFLDVMWDAPKLNDNRKEYIVDDVNTTVLQLTDMLQVHDGPNMKHYCILSHV